MEGDPYRKSARPRAHGQPVVIRTYLDVMAAEMDRVHLESEGITARVIEAASYNPALGSSIAGGIRLQVSGADAERANAILGVSAPEESEGDADDTAAVRCPRCELSYCFYERPRARHGLLALTLPLMMFMKKRWRCRKCEHVWDDPKAGPANITRLEPGDPRPAFRLRRHHGGMGIFVGSLVGMVLSLLTPFPYGLLLLIACASLGWLVGRAQRADVCSVPECRALVAHGAESCPRCKATLGGAIDSAPQHYAAAADFRRELTSLREADRRSAEAAPRVAPRRRTKRLQA